MLEANHPANDDSPFFPIMVNLRGKKCLLVGAGEVAAGKLAQLLHHNPQVEVVSPRAVRRIREKAAAGIIQWHCRRFTPDDVRGKVLVVAATGSTRINSAVFRACAEYGVLCNAVDDPAHCDFIYPAVVHRGPLQIAISTGGCSPTLAARLRRELEQEFGLEWSAWVERLGKLRREILSKKMAPATRRRRLEEIASPQAYLAFLRERRKDTALREKKQRVPSGHSTTSLSATPTR